MQALTCGVVERVLSWARVKSQVQLAKKQQGSKHSKLRGIPKLDDANEAGGKNSLECTLIVTEGDSAKTLAVSGLGVVGRGANKRGRGATRFTLPGCVSTTVTVGTWLPTEKRQWSMLELIAA